VIVIMAAGIRWMLARGDSGAVNAAKSQLTGGIIGLVALFSIVAITEFIDPRLVEFGALRTPLLKPTEFFLDGQSCDNLPDDTIVDIIEPSGETAFGGERLGEWKDKLGCGYKAKITAAGEGSRVIGLGNSTCIFTSCSGTASCVREDTGNDYTCLECKDLYGGGIKTDGGGQISVSDRACEALSKDIGERKVICRAADEEWFDGGRAACYSITEQAEDDRGGLNCLNVQARAAQLDDPCSVYDDLYASSGGYFTYSGSIGDFERSGGAPLLESVCSDDPCNVSPRSCSVVRETSRRSIRDEVADTFFTCRAQ
jgi:hypothetical protein